MTAKHFATKETLKLIPAELKTFHMLSWAIAGLQQRLFWLSGLYFNTFISFCVYKVI
jgi:hypothetical protein